MKLVTWNIEWMNDWFSGNANPRWGTKRIEDGVEKGKYTAEEARAFAQKAANVIVDLNADLLCIQEGPSALAEMNLFIDDFLSDEAGNPLFEALIAPDGSSQKMYTLRRLAGAVETIEYAQDDESLRLMEPWDADVHGVMMPQAYEFTRTPLVVDASLPGGRSVRVIVLHTKSKYVHNGQWQWNDPARRQEFVVNALLARRRISAEGYRVRGYMDALLTEDTNRKFVILGDFNDGPGQDLFERSYLTHNVTDIVLGSTFYPSLILHHPIIGAVPTHSLFTARFDDFVDEIDDRPLLLDHILVSPTMRSEVAAAGIAHDEYEREVEGSGEARHQRPSDHRPVWVEFAFNPV